MSKQVTIGAKPKPAAAPPRAADDWVMRREASAPDADVRPDAAPEPAVAMKRLTIDVSEGLHARVKSQCAMRRVKMNDEIRALLERHFPADQDG